MIVSGDWIISSLCNFIFIWIFRKQKKDDDSFEIKKKKLGKEMIKNAGLVINYLIDINLLPLEFKDNW